MRVRHILPEMEKEEIERINKPHILDRAPYEDLKKGEDWKGWARVGLVRVAIYLSDDKYWNHLVNNYPIPPDYVKSIEKWKSRLSEMG